jgi:hypothetical protein
LFLCIGDLAHVKRIAPLPLPPTVRSDVLFFLICCECTTDRFIVRRYLERFGGDGVTVGSHGGVRRVEDFLGSHAGYAAIRVFWERCWARPGAEEIPEPEGELVVFEAFFIASLRLPTHHFVAEVLQRFEVQVHQLTPNVVVALAKYVWAVFSCGGQPSVEIFAKNYYLHWQKRKTGGKIAQFGSYTFTPRTGKTSTEVVELVPCARNKWGNWWDYWFYVSGSEVEDLPGLPVAVMCSIAMWHSHNLRWRRMMRTKGPSGALPARAAGVIWLRSSLVMECGPWRMVGCWAKYALARCLL